MVMSVSDMEAQIEVPYRPISVDEFDKMAEAGILAPDERVELIDGRIVVRERMNAPHASIVARIMRVLVQRLGDRAMVWPQLPLVISDRAKPFPDVTLVRVRGDDYRERLPHPEDVFAVVEVSDTRLAFDRGDKLRMYANAAIPEYGIVDVNARTIELCREPHDLGYGSRTPAALGDSIAFAAFPDVVFSVDELLG
jgi:Uma2 family endonuclease